MVRGDRILRMVIRGVGQLPLEVAGALGDGRVVLLGTLQRVQLLCRAAVCRIVLAVCALQLWSSFQCLSPESPSVFSR